MMHTRTPGRPTGKEPTEIQSLSAIEHILDHNPKRIRSIILHGPSSTGNPRITNVYQKAKWQQVKIESSPKGTAVTDEPARALIEPFLYATLDMLIDFTAERKKAIILVLDHLQDPQNFGALCRTAEALGVAGIIIPKDRSVSVTPGVYHASVGAVETVPIVQVVNLGDALRKLKEVGYWVLGSSLGKHGKQPNEMPDFEKVVLVLGQEADGISSGIEKACDWHVEIPLSGKVQSLNVSVAGGILLYSLAERLQLHAKVKA